jgi:hypothetical protein
LRLYGAKSWRKSIARGSSRINCAWWCRNKIFNRTKLVSRKQRR